MPIAASASTPAASATHAEAALQRTAGSAIASMRGCRLNHAQVLATAGSTVENGGVARTK